MNDKLEEWFKNAKSNEVNDTILLIENNTININDYDTSNYIICDLSSFEESKHKLYKKKNIIVQFSNTNIPPIFDISKKLLNYKLLFISPKTIKLNITNSLNSKEADYKYYVMKRDPYDFIIKNPINTTEEALLFILENHIFWLNYKKYEKVTSNINLSISKFHNQIKSDLNMLDKDQILTSRLAVVIYRVFYLDLEANTTKIGRYFHKESGTKSKTFNFRSHKLKGISYEFINKNFKGYDLSKNEKEFAIRKEIAEKLIKLNIDNLTDELIIQATGITSDEMKLISFNPVILKEKMKIELLG